MVNRHDNTGHLSAADAAAVAVFVERARTALGANLVDVRLFGSHARGDSRPDSDIDIALIGRSDRANAEYEATDIAFDVDVAHGVYISPRVIEHAVFEDPVWRTTGIVQAIEREGIRRSRPWKYGD